MLLASLVEETVPQVVVNRHCGANLVSERNEQEINIATDMVSLTESGFVVPVRLGGKKMSPTVDHILDF
jgi:hypothetical protein